MFSERSVVASELRSLNYLPDEILPKNCHILDQKTYASSLPKCVKDGTR